MTQSLLSADAEYQLPTQLGREYSQSQLYITLTVGENQNKEKLICEKCENLNHLNHLIVQSLKFVAGIAENYYFYKMEW